MKTIYFATATAQFRKANGSWKLDRSVTIDLTVEDEACVAFYQACTNWVYDNVDVAAGATPRADAGNILTSSKIEISKESTIYWVSSYGNNEYYSGASAYYCNMDWRCPNTKNWSAYAAEQFNGKSNDEVLAFWKQNTITVFDAVLEAMYPENTPENFAYATITFIAYTGSDATWTITFNATDTGVFEYAEDSLKQL